MSDQRFCLAAGQMTAGDDLGHNLGTCADLAAAAADRGATVLVLPECFAFLGRREADKFAVAEVLDAAAPGRILSTVMDIAQRHGMWVIGGGMPERRPEDDPVERVFNTLVAVSPDGALAATYRKIHLFDVDIPDRVRLVESDSTYAGEDVVTVDVAGVTVGLSICYDLRFPEMYRKLVDAGAECIVVPAAFTATTGQAHWHVLLRARAIESQCWVAAAAQVGQHNPKRHSYGHSVIIDPWGTVVAERPAGTGVIVADIDADAVAKTRRNMPCLQHRRL